MFFLLPGVSWLDFRKQRVITALTAAGVALGNAASSVPAGSTTAPKTARQIMEEVDRRHRSDFQYSEGLVTVEEKGKVRKKAWRSWRAGWGGESRGLIQFLEPAEVKGVSLLTVSHPGRPDEQWFYTPAIDRDRRIAPQEKPTRFLGTHFTYEDMEERVLDDYEYSLLGEEPLDEAPCWQIEARPKPGKESQYSRLVFRVREDLFTTALIEGFVAGELRRTFRVSALAPIEGIPTAQRWEVTDAKREGKTMLELRNVRYHTRVEPGMFTLQALRILHESPP